jgi:hypothetical protein
MASDNCAVGSDGNLLDASQIPWFNDPDDDQPIAPTSSSAQRQASASRTVTTLDSFVTKVPPAMRRSTRAPRSSTKAIDPDNIMALKRKSSNTGAGKPSCRPRHASPDHEEDEATEPDPTDADGEDDDPVDADAAYEETKALGDADREVSAHSSSFLFLFDTLQRSCTRSLK